MSYSPSQDVYRPEALAMPNQGGWTVQQHPNHAAAHPQPLIPAGDKGEPEIEDVDDAR